MIKKLQMYTVICDGCGVSVFDAEEYSCTGEKEYATEVALDSDWLKLKNKHYCPDCYAFNDDDKPINPITLKLL